MSTTIKLRRSAVHGRSPTTSQLELGEIAINTVDGKVFLKKTENGLIDTRYGGGLGYAVCSQSGTITGSIGSGYTAGTFDLTGGTGEGAQITISQSGGAVSGVFTSISAQGKYYTVGDILLIDGGDSNAYIKVLATENGNSEIVEIGSDPQAILDLLKTVDGTGSELDADLLDGQEGTYYLDFTNFTNLPDPELTVTGDVEGNTTFTDLGNANLTLELTNTGVEANTYGSSTEIPVITVDVDGRITLANTTAVAGVDDFSYDPANNTITLTTGDGSEFHIQTETAVELSGKVTGTATSSNGTVQVTTELEDTGVTSGTYGSASEIPVFTVDNDGRITLANTAAVGGIDDFSYSSSNNTITLSSGDGSVYHLRTETTVTLTGDVTGTTTSDNGTVSVVADISTTGVVAGVYGTASQIPIVTVAADGRITSMSNTAVAGVDDFVYTSANNTLRIETGDGSVFLQKITSFDENVDFGAGIDVTGNVTVSGTVDGRDIAADGTKLDGIEAGATGDQTATEILNLLLTVDGDGSGIDADSVDGYSASEILEDASNNAQSLIGDGEVFVYANTGVEIVSSNPNNRFNLNSANSFTFEIGHADTSSVTDVSLTDGNVLNGITFDTFGHVQTTSSLDLDGRYYTETELDAGQLDNRYYTESELDSGQLDNRYYTETEVDTLFFNVSGDTVTGNSTFEQNVDIEGNLQLDGNLVVDGTINRDPRITLYGFVNGFTDLVNLANGSMFTSSETVISVGDGLDIVGGTINANVEISHADTSSQANVALANTALLAEFISVLDVDEFGHVVTVEKEIRSYIDQPTGDARYVNETGDTMTGNLEVQAVISQEYSAFHSESLTLTTTSPTTLFSFSKADFMGGEFIITGKTGINKHITKLLVVHDGTTASATEFGKVVTNSDLATYDINISGSDVQILVTPSSATSTEFVTFATLIKD